MDVNLKYEFDFEGGAACQKSWVLSDVSNSHVQVLAIKPLAAASCRTTSSFANESDAQDALRISRAA